MLSFPSHQVIWLRSLWVINFPLEAHRASLTLAPKYHPTESGLFTKVKWMMVNGLGSKWWEWVPCQWYGVNSLIALYDCWSRKLQVQNQVSRCLSEFVAKQWRHGSVTGSYLIYYLHKLSVLNSNKEMETNICGTENVVPVLLSNTKDYKKALVINSLW